MSNRTRSRNVKSVCYKDDSSDEEAESNNKHTTKKLTTTSNNNNKNITITNGGGGDGTTEKKRTRGNLVEGAATDTVARKLIADSLMNGNVEMLGKSLDNLQVDLDSEVVKIIGDDIKGTAEDILANEESKLKILEREHAELIAKNKKEKEECYLLYQKGKDIRAETHQMRMRIQQLDREEETRARILAVAKQRLHAIQLFIKVREKETTSDLTMEEVEIVATNFDIIQEKIISVNEENAVNNMKVYIAILQKGVEMKVLRIFHKSRAVGMSSITEEEVALVADNLDVIDNNIAASEDDELRWNERLAKYNTQLH